MGPTIQCNNKHGGVFSFAFFFLPGDRMENQKINRNQVSHVGQVMSKRTQHKSIEIIFLLICLKGHLMHSHHCMNQSWAQTNASIVSGFKEVLCRSSALALVQNADSDATVDTRITRIVVTPNP